MNELGASETEAQPFVLEATVLHVVFASEDSRFRVVKARVRSCTPVHAAASPGATVRCVGAMAKVTPGEDLAFEGCFRESKHKSARKGELEFSVESASYQDPVTSDGVARAIQGLAPGLGPVTARKLVDALGGPEETLAALARGCAPMAMDALASARVPSGTWNRLVVLWQAKRAEREQDALLAGLGLPDWLASRAQAKYGRDAYRLIREDPYRLMDEVDGVGFLTADLLAQTLGIDRQSPVRAQACLVYALTSAAYERGHTVLSAELAFQQARKMGVDGPGLLEQGLQLALDDKRVEVSGQVLGLRTLLEDERALARWADGTGDAGDAGGDRVAKAVADHERETGQVLDAHQVRAVQLVNDFGVCLVTGGPGVGKSATAYAMVRLLEGLPGDGSVVLCAPTGRAAKRLEEATGRPASTLHRLLGQGDHHKHKFLYHAGNRLPAKSVLVDESSMIGSSLMASLLEALAPGTRVVFVGDKNQLPPVDPGAPFRDFLESDKIPSVKLTKIFRQSQDSRIVQSAHQVLTGKMPVSSYAGDRTPGGLFFVEEEDPEQVAKIICNCVSRSIPEQFRIQPRDIQVLVPMHKGPVGTGNLNRGLQEKLNPWVPGQRFAKISDRVFRVGDRVRQTKNDYKREIVNGDMGYVTQVFDKYENRPPEDQEKAVLAIKLDSEDREFYCTQSELGQLQLAYAGSIHSSQGGEFPAVVIGLIKSHWIMLNRTLLYTAITRAKSLCVLVGDKLALKRACENSEAEKRITYLSSLLKGVGND